MAGVDHLERSASASHEFLDRVPSIASLDRTLSLENAKSLPLQSVFKVFLKSAEPAYDAPWKRRTQTASTGSGVACNWEGKRVLLTNAHCVEHHVTVRIQKFGTSDKFPCKVLHIGYDCDLAMLDVEEEGFWKDLPLLNLKECLPVLYETVNVIGYPAGGDTVCVTKGVVSRITCSPYTSMFGRAAPLLQIQIDAAINPGNSGGPAVDGKKNVVGLAFSGYATMQNVGYIIPTVVINKFLGDVHALSKYEGVQEFGCQYQRLESDSVRKFTKMQTNQTGVLVSKIAPLGAAQGVLEVGDVIMQIDGNDIGNDGHVRCDDAMLRFEHFITVKPYSAKTQLGVLRKGERLDLEVHFKPVPPLAPRYSGFDCHPTYAIVGGLLFVPITMPAILQDNIKRVIGYLDMEASKLFDSAVYASKPDEETEVIALTQILAHRINEGFDDLLLPVRLHKFNGETVQNMKHLAKLVHNCQDEFLQFTLSPQYEVVLERAQVESAMPEILDTHCIPAAFSANLTADKV